MAIRRRHLLLVALAGAAAEACAHAAPPQRATPGASLPADFDPWKLEARGILSDVLETLRTFDTFQAFRASTAPAAESRLASELAWDPPSGKAWDEATHVTRGVRGRAEQLFQAVTTAQIEPAYWREQRAAADAAHDLLGLGQALGAYRDRVDVLPPGDASAALGLLDAAWAQWEAAAERWGVSRSEPIACAG